MRTAVYKYKLGFGEFVLETPRKSKFLSVKKQGVDIVAYFSVPLVFVKSSNTEKTHFLIIGTGQEFHMERGMEFIDSFSFDNDTFVVHAFTKEVTE